MKRSLWLLMFVALVSVGCGKGLTVLVVEPIDENEILEGKAVTLALANQPKRDADEGGGDSSTKCLCGGTGRSGDGLGPCACPDGCSCKKSSAEPVEPVEGKRDEKIDEIEQTQAAIAETLEKLASNQVDVGKRLEEFDIRLTEVEKRAAEPVTDMEEPETADVPAVPVAQVIVVSQAGCGPCVTFDRNEVPKLESSGWTVGTSADVQVLKADVADEPVSEQAREAIQLAAMSGTPYFAYFRNGRFVKGVVGYSPSTTVADELNKLIRQPEQTQTSTARARLPVVETRWGTIDLETYARNCNCSMCRGIRSLQSQYRKMSRETVDGGTVGQEPSSAETIEQVFAAMRLESGDVLADLGCGDGRILIEASRRFGCRCVGVEIDPIKVAEAREAVSAAGLSDRIQILEMDATRFQPAEHGVTAIVAYLYPELLSQLVPQFNAVRVTVTPFHQVPGLRQYRQGDVWVYDRRERPRVQPSNRRSFPGMWTLLRG